jgi:hypothetical protein
MARQQGNPSPYSLGFPWTALYGRIRTTGLDQAAAHETTRNCEQDMSDKTDQSNLVNPGAERQAAPGREEARRERNNRLAAQLRANLRKRKEQARARESGERVPTASGTGVGATDD